MPEVVPCQGPLGARIEGLDRGRANQPEMAALLNRALAEHLLVVVPGERMAACETVAFARAFGTPRTQLLRYKRSGDVPEVSVMVSTLMVDGTTDKNPLRTAILHEEPKQIPVRPRARIVYDGRIELRQGGSTPPKYDAADQPD